MARPSVRPPSNPRGLLRRGRAFEHAARFRNAIGALEHSHEGHARADVSSAALERGAQGFFGLLRRSEVHQQIADAGDEVRCEPLQALPVRQRFDRLVDAQALVQRIRILKADLGVLRRELGCPLQHGACSLVVLAIEVNEAKVEVEVGCGGAQLGRARKGWQRTLRITEAASRRAQIHPVHGFFGLQLRQLLEHLLGFAKAPRIVQHQPKHAQRVRVSWMQRQRATAEHFRILRAAGIEARERIAHEPVRRS